LIKFVPVPEPGVTVASGPCSRPLPLSQMRILEADAPGNLPQTRPVPTAFRSLRPLPTCGESGRSR
jgi:hypothetical protein